jgi:hypothetical protein
MQTSQVDPSQVQQDNRLTWQRILLSRGARIGILGAFLVMVCLALGFRILSTASIKGVANAPILLIQSPIDGTVTLVGAQGRPDDKKGENIFQIENKRLDYQRSGPFAL